MQVTLNQQDLQTAFQVYLKTIFNVPIEVVNVDIKGMRTTEGYTATVDVVVDGQPYIPPAKPAQNYIVVNDDAVEEEGIKNHQGLPELSAEEKTVWIELLDLLANNPKGINDAAIISKVEQSSDVLKAYAETNDSYNKVYNRFYTEANKEEPKEIVEEVINIEQTSQSEPKTQSTDTKEESEPEVERVQVGVNILGNPIYEEVRKDTSNTEIKKGIFS